MPLVSSTYQAPALFRHHYINTIYPALLRRVPTLPYERQAIPTRDQDVLNIDFCHQKSDKLIIAVHGLEGDSQGHYILGVLQYFYRRGWNVAGMNFRSCGGDVNEQLRTYNMGESSDLQKVVNYALQEYKPAQIALVGFSLGGNVVLKYLGESGRYLPKEIVGAVGISVPCHLLTAQYSIAERKNWIYVQKFLGTLNTKMKEKVKRFPNHLTLPKRFPRNFAEFDGQFTGPIHGYVDEQDYYSSCGSVDFMNNIHCPTLLINAQDDTFLSPACFPEKLAAKHKYLHLETPTHGGHCGFYGPDKEGAYWSERRAFDFINEIING